MLFAVLALNVAGAVTKAVHAVAVASATGMTSFQGLTLLCMKTAVQLGRTFTGHEVVFMEYSTSAFAYFCTSALLMLLFLLYRGDMRRQAKIWQHIDALEAGNGANQTPPLL